MKIAYFSSAIAESLADYAAEIEKGAAAAAKKHSKTLQMLVKKWSPKKSGAYQEGWQVKKSKTSRRGLTSFLVYNDEYRLPHLLEHSHALKRGGRTIGRVRAFPHINKNAEIAQNAYEKDVEELIKNAQK